MISTSDIIMHFKELEDQKVTPQGVLKEFHVGDSIQVDWAERGVEKASYKKDGIITQITDTIIYYRCEAGYCCAVSQHQMASGVKVLAIRKAKAKIA
jgi:hypothetical protein